ncbi:MAG TPA: AzlD domain-containing protein [Clostridiales bacterium]|nr:AzlD domain-containing protein [Clostridiales bacterium]
MNNYILLIILGMTAVTYIPRLAPFLMLSGKELPKPLGRFLSFIPCTALGALIIPGVFSSIPKAPHAAMLGFGFAAIYAWFRGGIIVPVLGSIVVAFLVSSI